LLDAELSLAQTPHNGSPYRHIGNVRKLTVRPFKIFYRVNEAKETVEMVRFWHSARREPKL
jgi:plasmid stabilization system protein ParE